MRPKWVWLLLILLCPAWAQADIEINERYERGEKIIGKVVPTNLPENAMMRGMFRVSGKASTWQPDAKVLEYAIWAEDGQHTVTAVGTWVVTDTGELGGALIDFGYYEYTATFVVGPGGPGPDPPPPGGPYQLMFFYEGDSLDNYPQAQRNLITSLALRNRLVSQGHVVLEMVEAKALDKPAPDRYKLFFDAVRGKTMPRLAFAPKEGGELREVPLPANEAELNELLKSVVLRRR